jgi:hypothetical protein
VDQLRRKVVNWNSGIRAVDVPYAGWEVWLMVAPMIDGHLVP